MRVKDLTYNQAIYGLTSGVLTKKYIGSQYTKLRNRMLQQVREVNLSDVKFRSSENITSVPTWKEVKKGSLEDIAHAIADINRITTMETVEKRRANRDKILAGMHKEFPFVNAGNLGYYADFFDWFHENAIAKLFDSDGETVKSFLKGREDKVSPSTPRGWARVMIKWLESKKMYEEAEKLGQMFFASYRRKGG